MSGRSGWALRAAVLVSLAGAAAGCGAARRPPARPLPRDTALLAARRPPLEAFRADLRGRLSAPEARGRFRAGLGASPPGFRLDVFHPVTGTTLLSLGMSGERMEAVWPRAGECLSAPAAAGLLGDLVGLPVEPEEWLPLLTGHVWPDGPDVSIVSSRHPPLALTAGAGPAPADRDRLLVTARHERLGITWEAELLAERDGLALRATRRVGGPGGEIRVEYPRWRHAGVAPAGPERIELRAPERRLRLELEVRHVAAGGPAAALLLPPRPAGCVAISPEELSGRLPFAAVPADGGR